MPCSDWVIRPFQYRERLAPSDRAGADGALEALFFEPSAIDWLDQAASITWEIAALAAALALWRDYGWRVSVPLAAAGWALSKSHFPPYGVVAGFALGIAVSQYLIHMRRGTPDNEVNDVAVPTSQR